jgi:hypothetical protein
MTQDEIIELVQEAGIVQFNDGFIDITKAELDKFANLVSAKEREACAKLIESRKTGANELMDAVRDMEARAIRARGQA